MPPASTVTRSTVKTNTKSSVGRELASGIASGLGQRIARGGSSSKYSAGGSGNGRKSYLSEWWHEHGFKYKESFAFWGFLLIVLLLVGVYAGYVWSQTPAGERALESFDVSLEDIRGRLNIFTTMTRIQESFQSSWSFNSNPDSMVKGLTFDGFDATAQNIPAGDLVKINYDIGVENINREEDIAATFYCTAVKIDTGEGEEELDIEGEIEPDANMNIGYESPTVSCLLPQGVTDDMHGQLTIKGGVSFAFETEDATLPLYIISQGFYEELEDVYGREWRAAFFEKYAAFSESELKVDYDGEPVSVAIGTAPEGNFQHPVVAGEPSLSQFIGVRLKNEWRSGEVTEIADLKLTLPWFVTIDETKSYNPNIICPFILVDRGTNTNLYEMDEQVQESIFATGVFETEQRARSFECYLNIDPAGLSNKDYDLFEYSVDVTYEYSLDSKSETVTIFDTAQEIEDVEGDESGGGFGSLY